MNWLSPVCIGVAMITLCACAQLERRMSPHERWAAYYDNKESTEKLTQFDLVVLDGESHPDLAPLKSAGVKLLGYVSIGEVHDGKQADLPQSAIIKKNDHWNSYMVDVRDTAWRNRILEHDVPAVLAQGFDGVMLDTMDSPLYLEASQPEQYKGMRESLIYIVKRIRYDHPHIKIMVNRAFDMLPDIASDIDMVLAEGTLSHYDLEKKRSTHQPDAIYMQYVEKIHRARQLIPNLGVYTLDYWDMNDDNGVAHIYETQRKQGFVPYVTTPNLTTIHHESNASTMDPDAMGIDNKKGRLNA